MFTDVEVRQAVEFESATHPVLSIYPNVDPTGVRPKSTNPALRNFLTRPRGLIQDVKRMQNYVEMGHNWQGRGIIMFSCEVEGFWWANSLIVCPGGQRRRWGGGLMCANWLRCWTHERAASSTWTRRARLYVFNMGVLEAVEGSQGEVRHKAGRLVGHALPAQRKAAWRARTSGHGRTGRRVLPRQRQRA
ncbi:MAG: hypothetical protein R3A10_02845 [Caldilineaceae bacterium]